VSSEIAIQEEMAPEGEIARGPQEPRRSNPDGLIERWLNQHLDLVALAVTVAGLIMRVYMAVGSYLNPDEALHYLMLNQPSLLLAYKASLTNAHPPLIYFLVYFFRILGRSELMLRLPSVLAGTALCWVTYKWISVMWGKTAGAIGLILVSLSPAFVALSAELRSYALLLLFETAALYLVEVALRESSARKMWYSTICLYLALLSHYSAIFFAAAAGVYALARLAEMRSPRKILFAWAAGQAGAVAILAFLYVTHISKIRNSISAWAMPFDQSYYRLGTGNFFAFAQTHTLEFFNYLFENQYTASSMFLAWVVAVALLLYNDWKPNDGRDHARFSGVLLLFPFIAAWVGAIAGIYPYVGDRHIVFLAPFVIAAVSFLLASVFQRKIWAGVVMAALLVTATITSGKTFEPYISRENQNRTLMVAATNQIRQNIPKSNLIMTDLQSGVALTYYLCGPKAEFPVRMNDPAEFFDFSCDGRFILSFRVWKISVAEFPIRFQTMARRRNLQPGDRVWYFQDGWGLNLNRTLPWARPEFRCMVTQKFGGNISIMPFDVGPDLMPVATVTSCPPPAFNSFEM